MIENTDQHGLLQVIIAGGWVMIPLLLCSIATVAIIVERSLYGPNRRKALPMDFIRDVQSLVHQRRLDEANGLCRAHSAPVARVLHAALRHVGRPREVIIEAAQAAGRRESFAFQRYLGALGTIASISPLLGLLGTVSGMIRAFAVMQQVGSGQAQLLAGGISEALITTATGLGIAVPALFFYRFFSARAKMVVSEMEEVVGEIVNDLPTEPFAASSGAARGTSNNEPSVASISEISRRPRL